MPRIVADREPTLVYVPADDAPEPREIWQSVHRDLRDAARIHAVLEFLGKVLGPPTGAGRSKR